MPATTIIFFTITLLLQASLCEGGNNEEETDFKFEVDFDLQNMSSLIENFDEKKVVKSPELTLERSETVSRLEYIQEALNESLSLGQSQDISAESTALYENLKKIEAIEINLKVASKHENRINKLCSIYFEEYEALKADQRNKDLDDFEVMQKYISNIDSFNYAKAEVPGLFISQELSRDGDLVNDSRHMEFLIQSLPEVLGANKDQHLLTVGSWLHLYKLPDNPMLPESKQVVKVMEFHPFFRKEVDQMISDGLPIIDIIFFAAKYKKDYFNKLFKAVKINADLNQYKVIFNNFMTRNDPSKNEDSVSFYGCVNFKYAANFKADHFLFSILDHLKSFYSGQIDDPEEPSELTYHTLVSMLNNQTNNTSQDFPELSVSQKQNVLSNAFKALDISEHYVFMNVFERYDSDLFSDEFQKIYFLQINNFEIRLQMYKTLARNLLEIHRKGISHCDVKMTNLLYKIIPSLDGFYNIDYSNIRFSDFTKIKYNTRFCQGGTIGYLPPEVEHPLRLPMGENDFMDRLRNARNDIQDELESLDLGDYSKLQKSLVNVMDISIPQDYIDLRIFFDDVSIVEPDSVSDWVKLFEILSPVFTTLKLVEKIDYTPAPGDVDLPSSRLKIMKKKKKRVINFDPSSKINTEMLKSKFQKYMNTKPVLAGAEASVNPMQSIATPKNNKKIILEFRGLDQKPRENQDLKRKFQKRFTSRRWMIEGSMVYPSELIAPLNKADVFSLGVLFTEIETALNSNSIFNVFSSIPLEDFSKAALESTLHRGIRDSFLAKTKGHFSVQEKQKIQDYFKNEKDMKMSLTQYYSQTKALKGKQEAEFVVILNQMRDLLINMTSYYSHDRMDLDQILELLENFDDRMKTLYHSNKGYKNKMDVIQSTVKKSESNLFKLRYKQIYNLGKRLLI